ncbi:Antirestriction protein KlcA [Rubrivivax sp. A210]|uniref:antirestriction protein n=1 Tax=Rubrivivax sp. A210 TaxID=2772301 RepID=UPI001987D37A|nr:antirestriction protein [Rubrivivax sp. A210]CAD5366675.1 Antirestriction protein KlcA [Rubrivivax sp. A210]
MADLTLGEASLATTTTTTGIRCNIVPDDQRMDFLPRVFGARHMLAGEAAVFNWMAQLCPEYKGGFWDFVDLSNGGFYLRLKSDKHFTLRVDGNGFTGTLSADAASIVATLFAINGLLFKGAHHLHDAFYALKDFAVSHPEGHSILWAMD